MSDLVGRRLGTYELADVLRQGRTATRYRAASAGRLYVVTVYEPETDQAQLRALLSDVRAVAALRHPNLVVVEEVGEVGGRVYLVEEYFGARRTLADRPAGTMDPAGAVGLMCSVLGGLGHAHQHGVVHGSVTSRHILLAPPLRPVLVDFAVGRAAGGHVDQATGARMVVGTPAYLAPEQAFGLPAEPRSDLYSAGVVLYELLTGQVPFVSDEPQTVLRSHASEPPPPPRSLRPDLRPELEALLLQTLAKDPAERPQSAGVLAGSLMAALRGRVVSADPLSADYEQGVRAFARGEWHKAVELLGHVADVDPDYEDVDDLLRTAREETGEVDEG